MVIALDVLIDLGLAISGRLAEVVITGLDVQRRHTALHELEMIAAVEATAFGMRIWQDHPTPGLGHGIQDRIDR